MQADAPIVEITQLTKKFGTYSAVSKLELTVERGEIFTLLGPNGAGKTTTLRMLMGILGATEGQAHIAGYDCFSQREKVMEHVGYVPDEPAFYEHLRGSEILDFVASMNGVDPDSAATRLQELSQRLSLADDLHDFATNYSHGMKKKLALMAALLPNPDLLILDEPTNGLDPIATRALHELMREERQRGTAILFSTHLLDQAQKLCDRVAIMHRSKLVALGPLDALRGELKESGSLEDIFFQVTGRATATDEADNSEAPEDQSQEER